MTYLCETCTCKQYSAILKFIGYCTLFIIFIGVARPLPIGISNQLPGCKICQKCIAPGTQLYVGLIIIKQMDTYDIDCAILDTGVTICCNT